MVISHKYRFIFIKTKKTAGTSIEACLSHVCAENDIFTPISPIEGGHRARNYRGLFNPAPELIAGRGRRAIPTLARCVAGHKFYNHIPAYEIRCRAGRKIWNSYFKFCFERNPWDKVLSDYYAKKDNYHFSSIDEYLDHPNLCINYPIYTDGATRSRVIVDRIASYENLTEELTDIFSRLGVPFSGSLELRAKSQYRPTRRHRSEELTDNQRDRIFELFKREIEMHQYSF